EYFPQETLRRKTCRYQEYFPQLPSQQSTPKEFTIHSFCEVVLEAMIMEEEEEGVQKSVAVTACTAMALFYVAILYSPTLILRLPPSTSFASFTIRRFICAAVSSVLSLVVSAFILPANPLCGKFRYKPLEHEDLMRRIRNWEASYLSGVYGIRLDHLCQAVVYPVFLTSLMYAGSFVLKSMSLLNSWREHCNVGESHSSNCIKNVLPIFIGKMFSLASNVLAWRNYFVAPITEELVFRACMIPLLLCGGFKTYNVIFFCPIFFSLAHLNHFLEMYTQQNHSLLNASMIVGLQLGYTVIFGSYASFLFIRTGHLIAPVVSHILCNFMGLPVLYSRRNGIIVSLAFIAGMVSFLWLLFPATHPDVYNDRTEDSCKCWQRYCTWN
ncbi:CAAX prenyl protease 2, variant 2, partial [Sarracenia purpurea var. burkii]